MVTVQTLPLFPPDLLPDVDSTDTIPSVAQEYVVVLHSSWSFLVRLHITRGYSQEIAELMATAIVENAPPEGTRIGVREAAEKYDVSEATISRMVSAKRVPWLQEPRGRGTRGYIDEHWVYIWLNIAPARTGRKKPKIPEN